MGLRITRSSLLLLAGLLAVFLNGIMEGYVAVFAITLVVSAAFTLIYIFLHFDEKVNEKVLMELLADGFAGVVLFTYPGSSNDFLFIVFGFWIFFMGTLFLSSGLLDEGHKPFFWLYVLLGIVNIIFGFAVMNFDLETGKTNVALYLIGFAMIVYAGISLFLLVKRKRDVY